MRRLLGCLFGDMLWLEQRIVPVTREIVAIADRADSSLSNPLIFEDIKNHSLSI